MRTLTGTHFIASRQALSCISKLPKSAHHKLLPYRWKGDPSLKVAEIVWREDMDDFVLEEMRKSITEELIYLASRPAAYIAVCKKTQSIDKHHQVSAAFWLGDAPNAVDNPDSETTLSSTTEQGPPLYAMYRYKSQFIPYYNLLALLGPASIGTLRQSKLRNFEGRIAVIKAKMMTVKVQLALWKLLGFLVRTFK